MEKVGKMFESDGKVGEKFEADGKVGGKVCLWARDCSTFCPLMPVRRMPLCNGLIA